MLLFKREKMVSRSMMDAEWLQGDEEALESPFSVEVLPLSFPGLSLQGICNRWDRIVISSARFPSYGGHCSADAQVLLQPQCALRGP
jgi:hypothetical protein